MSSISNSLDGETSGFCGWAYIKYPDKMHEYVMTISIEDFHPRDPEDFVFGKKYVVRSSAWNSKGRIQRNLGYICRMAETLEALKECVKKNRPKYPPLKDKEENYLSSLSEHERKTSVGNYLAHGQSEALKRKAAAREMALIVGTICSSRKEAIQQSIKEVSLSMPSTSQQSDFVQPKEKKKKLMTCTTSEESAVKSKSADKTVCGRTDPRGLFQIDGMKSMKKLREVNYNLQQEVKKLEEEKRVREMELRRKSNIEDQLDFIKKQFPLMPTLGMFQNLEKRLESIENSIKSRSNAFKSNLHHM